MDEPPRLAVAGGAGPTIQQPNPPLTRRLRTLVIWLQRRILGLSRHWLAWANLFWGVVVGLPWLAPVLMHSGATAPARAIYAIYSFLCHQLASRSYFLFGTKLMYSFDELQSIAPDANTWSGLRAIVGTSELGYKVAWSDRMVSLYGGVFLGGLLFVLLRQRLRPPRWRTVALMAAPIILDGLTHWISDLAGLGQGFRYTNAWLAALTGHTFSDSFYVGDALGSFNSSMRLITGLLAGLAAVWLVFPLMEIYFGGLRQILEPRHEQPHSSRESRGTWGFDLRSQSRLCREVTEYHKGCPQQPLCRSHRIR